MITTAASEAHHLVKNQCEFSHSSSDYSMAVNKTMTGVTNRQLSYRLPLAAAFKAALY